jgi:hypothetical protein
MKRFAINVVLLMLAASVFAQEEVLTSKNGIPILPVKGDLSIGIDAVPFFNLFKDNSASPGFNFTNNIPSIAVKYFLEDNRALRMECMIGYSSMNYENSGKILENSFGLSAGYEWRTGSSRVQGYTGVQGGGFYGKDKTIDSNENVLEEESSFGIVVQGFLGAEYFIAPKLSIGGEFTWGPTYTVITDNVNSEKLSIVDIGASNANGALMLTFHF